MSGLETIPVTVVTDEPLTQTGNMVPILNEIRHALSHLAETGESTTIDLGAIPFGPGGDVRNCSQLWGRARSRPHCMPWASR